VVYDGENVKNGLGREEEKWPKRKWVSYFPSEMTADKSDSTKQPFRRERTINILCTSWFTRTAN